MVLVAAAAKILLLAWRSPAVATAGDILLGKNQVLLGSRRLVLRVWAVEGDVKAAVLSGGLLGEAGSKNKRVGVAREGVNRGNLTLALTLTAMGWLQAASLTKTRFSVKLRRPVVWTEG